jgi:hypothetical protein
MFSATPMTVENGVVSLPMRSIFPMGSCPGHKAAAMFSVTTRTRGVPERS